MKVIYLYARDIFKDNNKGFLFGVEGVTQDGISQNDYIEWFKTIEQLKQNTIKYKLKPINEEEFFNYIKQLKGGLK